MPLTAKCPPPLLLSQKANCVMLSPSWSLAVTSDEPATDWFAPTLTSCATTTGTPSPPPPDRVVVAFRPA